jgi:hypothetical protein
MSKFLIVRPADLRRLAKKMLSTSGFGTFRTIDRREQMRGYGTRYMPIGDDGFRAHSDGNDAIARPQAVGSCFARRFICNISKNKSPRAAAEAK